MRRRDVNHQRGGNREPDRRVPGMRKILALPLQHLGNRPEPLQVQQPNQQRSIQKQSHENLRRDCALQARHGEWPLVVRQSDQTRFHHEVYRHHEQGGASGNQQHHHLRIVVRFARGLQVAAHVGNANRRAMAVGKVVLQRRSRGQSLQIRGRSRGGEQIRRAPRHVDFLCAVLSRGLFCLFFLLLLRPQDTRGRDYEQQQDEHLGHAPPPEALSRGAVLIFPHDVARLRGARHLDAFPVEPQVFALEQPPEEEARHPVAVQDQFLVLRLLEAHVRAEDFPVVLQDPVVLALPLLFLCVEFLRLFLQFLQFFRVLVQLRLHNLLLQLCLSGDPGQPSPVVPRERHSWHGRVDRRRVHDFEVVRRGHAAPALHFFRGAPELLLRQHGAEVLLQLQFVARRRHLLEVRQRLHDYGEIGRGHRVRVERLDVARNLHVQEAEHVEKIQQRAGGGQGGHDGGEVRRGIRRSVQLDGALGGGADLLLGGVPEGRQRKQREPAGASLVVALPRIGETGENREKQQQTPDEKHGGATVQEIKVHLNTHALRGFTDFLPVRLAPRDKLVVFADHSLFRFSDGPHGRNLALRAAGKLLAVIQVFGGHSRQFCMG
mmetsp:Transcript_4997/g.12545  ORF Transcript_4997/g.12545 Transcript_4997/m.12545 type:complete len:604 (-) Transcript_4997:111-1922(-)